MQQIARALFLTLLLAGCAPLDQALGPSPPSGSSPTGPPGIALSDLTMVTPKVGWALRLNGSYGLIAVVRTTDGGARWKAVTPPHAAGYTEPALATTGPKSAWVTLRRKGILRIASTTDAGGQWRLTRVWQSAGVGADVQFTDPAHGFVSLGDGVAAGSSAMRLLGSNDGGRTWQLRMRTSGLAPNDTPGAVPFACDKGEATFASPTHGFIGGACSGGHIYFYASTDAGIRWHRVSLPGVPRSCQCDVAQPTFFSATGGTLTAGIESKPSRVFITSDAGATWHPLAVRAASPGAVSFADARHGWVATAPTVISRTADGGRHWRPVTTPFEVSQSEIHAISPTVIYAHEGYPHADRTWWSRDGGRHWRLTIARRG